MYYSCYKCVAFLDDLSKRLDGIKLTDSKITVPEMLNVSEGKMLTDIVYVRSYLMCVYVLL